VELLILVICAEVGYALSTNLNVLLIIAFFCLVFHVTLNSRNAKLKTYGAH